MSTHIARLTRRAFVVRGTWSAVAAMGVGILAACSQTSPAAPALGPTTAPAAAPTTAKPAAAATTAPAAPAATSAPQNAAPGTAQPAAGGKLQLPTLVPPKGPAPDVKGTD